MIQKKRKTLSFWAGMVGVLFMLAFFIVIGRFVFIAQGREIDGHQLTGIGVNQWTQFDLIDEKRGTIYSSNGRVLAQDIPAYTLYAIISPHADNHVKDKEKTASKLAPILGMKVSEVQKVLEKDAYQVEFGKAGKKISGEQKDKIEQLKLPGIGFIPQSKRNYPEQNSAAYTIGFTQTDPKSNQQIGVFGIEQSLNKYLAEKDGSVSYYRTPQGIPIPGEVQNLSASSPGKDVYLTLNSRVQTVLDQAMQNTYDQYKPESMIGIVADPKTGKILGMSSKPSFDLNTRNIEQFINPPINARYEPGSVMKAFTVAAAIDAGVYNGNATYKSGKYAFAGGVVHDWKRSGWGTITFDQGFKLSSNVAMSILTDKRLGTDRLKSYLDRFGFMKKTGIDLPGEVSSAVNWNSKIDQVFASFGQGSAFTSMQIIQAATAIANNGTMMRPYIVDKVVDPKTNQTVLEHKPVIAGQPISKEAAEQTRALMRQVVSDTDVVNGANATGVHYDLPGYDVIGKTGTAQIYLNGQLLSGRDNHIFSFLGMAPEKDPKVVVYVAIRQPHLTSKDLLDSQPVINVVRPVMSSTLQYMDVKQSKEGSKSMKAQTAELDDLIGTSMQDAVQSLKKQGLDPIAIGDGQVTNQMPYPGQELIKGSKVILSGSGEKKMPDLSGWSLGDSMKVSEAAGMHPEVKGEGFVIGQQPAPGSVIKSGDTLKLQMGTKAENQEGKQEGDDSSSSAP